MKSYRQISTVVGRALGRWPVAVLVCLVLAAALLLPAIARPGLWEPGERALADRIAPPIPVAAEIEAKKQAQPQPPPAPEVACRRSAPENPVARSLSNRAMKLGRDHIADSDGGRKLPFALLGLLTVLATAGIAMATTRASGRAGIVAAIVVLSMPLLVLQSRMLTSDIGTACGGALLVYGLLAIRRGGDAVRGFLGGRVTEGLRATVATVIGAVAICAGLVIGFVAGGALLGLLVPIGAVAAAGKLGVPFVIDLGKLAYNGVLRLRRRSKWAVGRRPCAYSGESYGPAFLATLATIALIGLLAYQLYDLTDPYPGFSPPVRKVFETAIVPEGCWSTLLGGIWRPEDDLRYAFDSSFEQIAYGTFPWGILGPIAMILLLRDADPGRRLVGALTLAWAGGAWIATEAFNRKVGITIWPGFPALAIAIGVWLDGLLDRRARGDAEGTSMLGTGAVLLALFFFLAVLDFGKDLQSFPEKLTSLLALGDTVTYPANSTLLVVKTKLWILVGGMGCAVGVTAMLALWRPDDGSPWARKLRRISAWGGAGALGASIVLAGFWAFAWHPRLAEHLSSKAMFDMYRELRRPGDQLIIMGDLGHAPLAYADAPAAKAATATAPADPGFEKANARDQVVTALKRSNRVFAIAPQSELCALHRELGDKPYFVIDDRNTRNLLVSNKLDGASDKNPLREMILHEEPKRIAKRPKGRVVWDNRIELLGWDMPASVQRGASLEVTLYYKILQPVGGNWTAIMHFDGAIRFSGDHKPIEDRCPTSSWQQGDYIVDKVTVTAGSAGHPLGSYELWIGFFTGTAPNFKNMTISAAPSDIRDSTDRVKITNVILD